MDHTRLKTFQVVSELLSFRKASQALHLTQPAITAHIKVLEESLGVALFYRNGRGVTLTPAGKTLLIYAHRMEEIRNQAIAALAEYGGQKESEISIGVSPAVSVGLLPRILVQLQKTWPTVRARVLIGNSLEVMQSLEAQKINLGVVEGHFAFPGLNVQTFGQDELVPIVSTKHAWAHKHGISDGELAEQPLILAERGSAARQTVENYLKKNGILSQVDSIISINSSEALIAAVESGLGIGFTSRLVLNRLQSTKTIKELFLKNGSLFQPLSFSLRKGEAPQGPASEVIQLLLAGLQPAEPELSRGI